MGRWVPFAVIESKSAVSVVPATVDFSTAVEGWLAETLPRWLQPAKPTKREIVNTTGQTYLEYLILDLEKIIGPLPP
jgi:hypothetical protein